MNLAIVKTFDSAFEAHLIKGLLNSEEIESFLFDENTVATNPLYNITVGGIKLKVKEEDYDRAMEIINASEKHPITDDNEQEIKCPNCGSTDLYSGFKTVKSFRAILATVISILLMAYPLYYNLVYKCKQCDESFMPKK